MKKTLLKVCALFLVLCLFVCGCTSADNPSSMPDASSSKVEPASSEDSPSSTAPPSNIPTEGPFAGMTLAERNKYIASLRKQNQVAITVDDEPSAYTEYLLDGLKALDVDVTFFIIGKQVSGRESIVQKMYAEGHEIGNHTQNHLQGDILRMEFDKVKAEITNCENAIKSAVPDVKIKNFRGPGGAYTDDIKTIATELGYKGFGWSLSIDDYQTGDKQQIIADIVNKVRNGEVILVHNHSQFMAELIIELAKQLKDNGFTPVTLESLMLRKGCGIVGNQYSGPIV